MGKSKVSFLSCALALSMSTGINAQDVPCEQGKYAPQWESLKAWECPEWFKDAKFGIWAHWGPQCQAEAGDWYARHMYYENEWQHKWHVEHFGSPETFGLKELCNAWKADKWNPEALISLYKSVGAKYFFTLGQHHDNFDLWDSPYQEWNSVNIGPKRDIVKEWAEACKRHDLPLGISMHGSHTWTWLEKSQDYDGNLTKEDGYKLNPDGTEKWWKGYDPQELYAQRHPHSTGWEKAGGIHGQWDWANGASLPSEAFKMKFQNRVLQCVNAYNPQMLYFDDTVLPFYGCDDNVGLNILSHFYNHSANQHGGTAECVVMGKQLNDSQKEAMLWDVERGVPDRMQEKYWQTCTCIGEWHYNQGTYNGSRYKSAQQVICMLVDIISKNGNLLLSVPIKGDGTIDDKEVEVLMGIKAWMDINGKSVYGTRPWKTFGEGPLAESSNPLNSQGFNEKNNYSAEDVRFVQRNDTLYATIMRNPSTSRYTIKSLGYASKYYNGKVKKVELLGYGEIDFENSIDGLVLSLPAEPVNDIAPVLEITFDINATDDLSLSEIMTLYKEKIVGMKGNTHYCNTGKWNKEKFDSFARLLSDSKKKLKADKQQQYTAIKQLNVAYQELMESGINPNLFPQNVDGQDVTKDYLLQSSKFSTKEETSTRFATPLHWEVENFRIPNGKDGIKNGIDKYTGESNLMLGVWNDARNNNEGNLKDARITRTIRLKAGKYFFGAIYDTTHSMSDEAYVFVAGKKITTGEIPSESIAYSRINNSAKDKFSGVFFTLDKTTDVCVGFQANLLKGSPTQEFRVKEVTLRYYGKR